MKAESPSDADAAATLQWVRHRKRARLNPSVLPDAAKKARYLDDCQHPGDLSIISVQSFLNNSRAQHGQLLSEEYPYSQSRTVGA